MKLKSFGCSFIWGSELSDCPDSAVSQFPVNKHSRLTWPALVATQLGLEYECHARPGSGNLQIAERVLNELANNSSDLFVINWTFIDRFDYRGPEDEWQPWRSITPTSTQDYAESYYRHLHSEYRDKLTTLMQIKLVLDTLKASSTPFIMTYTDGLMFDTRWHTGPAILSLQNQIKPWITEFEGQTFLDWAELNNFPISAGNHPLEEAHRSAYNIIIDLLDHNILDTKVKTI